MPMGESVFVESKMDERSTGCRRRQSFSNVNTNNHAYQCNVSQISKIKSSESQEFP